MPTTVLRIEDYHASYARKGFFRIGLLPQPAFTGVVIEFSNNVPSLENLQTVHKWFEESKSGACEMEGVRMTWRSDSNRTLEAGRAFLDGGRSLATRVEESEGPCGLNGRRLTPACTGFP